MAGFKGITIGYLNIRSLNRKLEEVIRILDEGDLEILCIGETWLNRSVPDHMMAINGYNMHRWDRNSDSGKATGGGLIVYYKNHLNVSMIPDLCTCSPNLETLWVKLSLKQARPQYVGMVYRPPDGDPDVAINVLNDQLLSVRNLGNGDQMILGDVNVDWKRKREAKTKKLVDFYKNNGLTNLIDGTTCHHNDSDSCLDHMAVNREDMYQLHGIIGLNASDHNLIYGVRKQPKIKRTYKFIWARSYRGFDHLLFERDIIFQDWADVIDEPDSDMAWCNFSNRLISIMDKHAPLKKLRVSDSMPKWVTREYLSACDERDALHRKYSRDKTDRNKAEMKRSRNYATKLKNDLKRDYFHKAIRESQGDSKKLWKTINEAFGKTNTKSTHITELAGETDPQNMANKLNDYFSTIADKLAEGFPQDHPIRTEDVKHQPRFEFSHVTPTDIEKQIRLLSDATAVGIDGISPRILRAALKPLSILICKLINRSLDTGVFPAGLKVARVSPIYKSGDRTDPGNYRPISVLPSVSKIYEHVVHTQLANYIDKYSLLSNSQFGFRKNHSTRPAVYPCWIRCMKNLNRVVSVGWSSWT